jgi:phosphopantothenoylcysteine decarboxylase/phosphopantothenate--cysteine ligase
VNVLLGVTGGIAAYKACELVRRLREGEHAVQVVMTEAATAFVSPMTFSVLSGRKAATRLFGEDDPEIDHIRLARWPDVIAIAPATAHTLARLAHGLADDLLSTVVLAARPEVTVVLAPAMNTVMWENPLVQRNLALLEETGRFRVVPPVAKTLACGESGVGGLAEESAVLAAILEARGRAEG